MESDDHLILELLKIKNFFKLDILEMWLVTIEDREINLKADNGSSTIRR